MIVEVCLCHCNLYVKFLTQYLSKDRIQYDKRVQRHNRLQYANLELIRMDDMNLCYITWCCIFIVYLMICICASLRLALPGRTHDATCTCVST